MPLSTRSVVNILEWYLLRYFEFSQASGMKIYHMVLTGFGVKFITLALSLVAANTYGGPLLGMNQFPDWANSSANVLIL